MCVDETAAWASESIQPRELLHCRLDGPVEWSGWTSHSIRTGTPGPAAWAPARRHSRVRRSTTPSDSRDGVPASGEGGQPVAAASAFAGCFSPSGKRWLSSGRLLRHVSGGWRSGRNRQARPTSTTKFRVGDIFRSAWPCVTDAAEARATSGLTASVRRRRMDEDRPARGKHGTAPAHRRQARTTGQSLPEPYKVQGRCTCRCSVSEQTTPVKSGCLRRTGVLALCSAPGLASCTPTPSHSISFFDHIQYPPSVCPLFYTRASLLSCNKLSLAN